MNSVSEPIPLFKDLSQFQSLKQLLEDLKKMNIQPYIGYGNPNAKILIIGKECASYNPNDRGCISCKNNNDCEEYKNYKEFYEKNFEQWYATIFEGHPCSCKSGENPYDFESKNFHPRYPFFRQENKIRQKGKEKGTSSTYYWYQHLVDEIFGRGKSEYINFFKDCFITELSDICRPNNKNISIEQGKETEDSIRNRFDWMRKTNFFNQFKVVILACGPYATAIKEDDKLRFELFGNARIFYCNQLSRWDKKIEEAIPEIKKLIL